MAGTSSGQAPSLAEQPRQSPPRAKTRIIGKILVFLFLFSTLGDLVRSLVNSIRRGRWDYMLFVSLFFLLFGLIAYRALGKFLAGREEYRRRFFAAGETVRLRDAALYALTFSREILFSIPADRQRLVRYALILIGIPFVILTVATGLSDLASVLLNLLLVLAGVNLLVWAVASERQERDRIRIELEAARQMQLTLMPAMAPKIRGYEIAGFCLPAQSVGGDQYDFVWLGEDKRRLGIAVVDVSGKGMDAALTAVYTSGAFVSETQHEREPVLIMRNLNAALRTRRDRRRFVSFLLLTLDADSRMLHCINAGQCRPLLFRDSEVHELTGSGPRLPLGTRAAIDYIPSELVMRAGDRLLLYTDGVTDAESPQAEAFGLGRLRSVFATAAGSGCSAEGVLDAVKTSVSRFSAGTEALDDITMVAVNVGDYEACAVARGVDGPG